MADADWLNAQVFVVEDFLTPDECDRYLALISDDDYQEGMLTSPDGLVSAENIRNNQRAEIWDENVAKELWEKAKDLVPTCEGRLAVGMNEMLRFYRYEEDQYFEWHQDFTVELDNGQQSFYTVLIYLNDDFEGGETSFNDEYSEEIFEEFQIVPQQGLAVFFEHSIHHKGEPVKSGCKHLLRTDLMYASEEPDYLEDLDDEDEENYDDDWE